MVSVGREDRDPAPSHNVQLDAGALTRSAGPVRRPAREAQPSWGRVLVNTVKLSVLRQLRAAGPRRRRASGSRPWHARRRWRFATLVLALAGAAWIVVWFTGGLTGTSSRATRVPTAGTGPPSLAAAAQAQAAAWIASQVSGSAVVACYPGLCAALQERGVAAGRLMPLWPAAASPPGADVLVTSASINGQLATRYAPALIASFGSGGHRVEVRAVKPGGASAYRAALRADLTARRAAGSQLLRNSHIRFTGPGAAQLRAGEVDTRLLATLAALASQFSFRVTAFGDAAPGAPVLSREVDITGIARGMPGGPGHGARAEPAVPARARCCRRPGRAEH